MDIKIKPLYFDLGLYTKKDLDAAIRFSLGGTTTTLLEKGFEFQVRRWEHKPQFKSTIKRIPNGWELRTVPKGNIVRGVNTANLWKWVSGGTPPRLIFSKPNGPAMAFQPNYSAKSDGGRGTRSGGYITKRVVGMGKPHSIKARNLEKRILIARIIPIRGSIQRRMIQYLIQRGW